MAEIDELREVMHWAQAMLTALNVGDVQKESMLHLKLREVMQTFRDRTGAPGSTCWLIERGQASGHTPTLWWCGGESRAGVGEEEMGNWTDDALKARRFPSQSEATHLAARLLPAGTYSVTENIFLGGAMMAAN